MNFFSKPSVIGKHLRHDSEKVRVVHRKGNCFFRLRDLLTEILIIFRCYRAQWSDAHRVKDDAEGASYIGFHCGKHHKKDPENFRAAIEERQKYLAGMDEVIQRLKTLGVSVDEGTMTFPLVQTVENDDGEAQQLGKKLAETLAR